jgi:hypothetical protein
MDTLIARLSVFPAKIFELEITSTVLVASVNPS